MARMVAWAMVRITFAVMLLAGMTSPAAAASSLPYVDGSVSRPLVPVTSFASLPAPGPQRRPDRTTTENLVPPCRGRDHLRPRRAGTYRAQARRRRAIGIHGGTRPRARRRPRGRDARGASLRQPQLVVRQLHAVRWQRELRGFARGRRLRCPLARC